VQAGETSIIMDRLNDPSFWMHYHNHLLAQLQEMLLDPDSDEEWIDATLNLLLLVEEIAEMLDPPR
jgi:hypothetical protein